MRVVVSMTMTLRLMALGFALGIVVGLWAGIEGASRDRQEIPMPEVTTTAPLIPEAAP
jgi:hypothetical protein